MRVAKLPLFFILVACIGYLAFDYYSPARRERRDLRAYLALNQNALDFRNYRPGEWDELGYVNAYSDCHLGLTEYTSAGCATKMNDGEGQLFLIKDNKALTYIEIDLKLSMTGGNLRVPRDKAVFPRCPGTGAVEQYCPAPSAFYKHEDIHSPEGQAPESK